jgi:hypothetical protein
LKYPGPSEAWSYRNRYPHGHPTVTPSSALTRAGSMTRACHHRPWTATARTIPQRWTASGFVSPTASPAPRQRRLNTPTNDSTAQWTASSPTRCNTGFTKLAATGHGLPRPASARTRPRLTPAEPGTGGSPPLRGTDRFVLEVKVRTVDQSPTQSDARLPSSRDSSGRWGGRSTVLCRAHVTTRMPPGQGRSKHRPSVTRPGGTSPLNELGR